MSQGGLGELRFPWILSDWKGREGECGNALAMTSDNWLPLSPAERIISQVIFECGARCGMTLSIFSHTPVYPEMSTETTRKFKIQKQCTPSALAAFRHDLNTNTQLSMTWRFYCFITVISSLS